MASVYLGQLDSAAGFSRVVAIKRMHKELARSPEFVEMFLQEARLVGRIQHPNVVAALDCVATDDNAMLIMEYVHGASLSQLLKKPVAIPLPAASAIVLGAALGLHAAHEAVDTTGKNLGIVHRDVSPQNIIVGVDGLARVLDFGVAKAAARSLQTRTGEIKGKLGYMAPEQLLGDDVGREADIYSLGIVLWELVTGRRLFRAEGTGLMMSRIAQSRIESPRSVNSNVSPEISAVVMKAVAASPKLRYRTALEFAEAVEHTIPVMAQRTLGTWVATVAKDDLAHRAKVLSHIEKAPSGGVSTREADTLPQGVPPERGDARRIHSPTEASTTVSRIAVIGRRSASLRPRAVVAASAVALVAAGLLLWPHRAIRPAAAEYAVDSAHGTAMGTGEGACEVQATTPRATVVEAVPQARSSASVISGALPEPAATAVAVGVATGREAPRPAAPRWRPRRARAGAPAPELDLGVIGGRE